MYIMYGGETAGGMRSYSKAMVADSGTVSNSFHCMFNDGLAHCSRLTKIPLGETLTSSLVQSALSSLKISWNSVFRPPSFGRRLHAKSTYRKRLNGDNQMMKKCQSSLNDLSHGDASLGGYTERRRGINKASCICTVAFITSS